jgi:hypothetical protein
MTRAFRRVLGAALGLVARLWMWTLRLTLVIDPMLLGHSELEDASDKPWILAFWHGQQFALLRWPRRRPTVALVSLSRDGEMQAAALPRVGLLIERGSSSRRGASGLKAIVRQLRAGRDAAFAVDGPRGPRFVVQSHDGGRIGATLAARLAKGAIVPMASACASCWVFRRSWDRFELPRPFSRVAVALGPPLPPRDLAPAELATAIDRARQAAEHALCPAQSFPAGAGDLVGGSHRRL